MKAREYEFEGVQYRWKCFPRPGSGNDLHIYHQRWHSYNGDWCSHSTPSTPAAAEALAALIEDMQVQVIAEWKDGDELRARELDGEIVVEYRDGDRWVRTLSSSRTFRAGYEAGKAAR